MSNKLYLFTAVLILLLSLVMGCSAPVSTSVTPPTTTNIEPTVAPTSTPPTSIPPETPALMEKEIELKYDDDKPDTFWPARPNVNLIICYKPPSIPFTIQNIKIFGRVKCTSIDLNTSTFQLIIWNQDRSKQFWAKEFSYGLFNDKNGSWVDFPVDDVEVIDNFLVEFDLTNRKCDLLMATDKSVPSPNSELYKWASVSTEGVLTDYYEPSSVFMVRIQGLAQQ